MEPAVAFGVVGKLIGLGIKGWQALDHRDFDKDDLEALRTLLDTGTSLSATRKPEAASAGALHLALIARSFGRAVGRHQMFHGKVPLTEGLRRWMNRTDREREKEISRRVRFAALKVPELGNDPVGEIERIGALLGDPVGTPYYRALWQAFSDPALTIEEAGESPPLVMSTTARREFERYFLLAYLESLAAAGSDIDRYRDGLARYRVVLIRDLLTRDLAAWGGRHVFGNVRREDWNDDEAIPFLPLEQLYVEPDGALEEPGELQPAEPLLGLIERLTATSAEPRVVVVAADFGSGKSLSARMLARGWAERHLTSPKVSLDIPLPIHVRCTDDFPSDTVDLELTMRHAWKRQADGIGFSVADEDEAFAWPLSDQRMVCLLDGLDEVSLGEQHLQVLFQKLRAKTTRNHRFVIFSRPGALLAQRDLGANVIVVRVQPFSPGQVEQWLARWNDLHSNAPPITPTDLAEHDLAAIAATPILLFMVAFTWGQETHSGPPSLAEIYERFFCQVASGKVGPDPDPHRPIAVASDRLRSALLSAGILDGGAERADAMLWLMGRVAWEAHMLEQRRPPEQLTRWHVDSMLRDGEVPIPLEAIDAIRLGLVLTLQADLHGANHTLLFGHQSFREFLVGRHWASTLRRLVRSRHGRDPGAAAVLLGGRLLGREDKSFDFLMQFINAPEAAESRAASPLGWSDDERERLVRWAQEVFEDERQEFGERGRLRRRAAEATLRNDQRAELREAALAIGSMTRGTAGMRANDPRTLRSVLAWFWLIGDPPIVIAPHVELTGAELRRAELFYSDLRGASLRGADLDEASLSGADLREADLSEAALVCAALLEADLRGAYLRGANLFRADLREANLCDADVREAELQEADLREAELQEADLRGAGLRMADLRGADLRRADLRGADLRGAALVEADLRGADLSQANLSTTQLKLKLVGSDRAIDDDSLKTIYDETTIWPEGFDPRAIGAGNSDG